MDYQRLVWLSAQLRKQGDPLREFAKLIEPLENQNLAKLQYAARRIELVMPDIRTATAGIERLKKQFARASAFHLNSQLPSMSYSLPIQTMVTSTERSEADSEIGRENELLKRKIRNLEWVLLGLGTEYPPASYESFDDFTDLSQN